MKPCGFALQNIKFSNCPCFQGKKIQIKTFFRVFLNNISKVWLERNLFKEGSHVAVRESHRLRLLVTKSSTVREGVRYFNVPAAEIIHLHTQRWFCLCIIRRG